MNDTARSEHAPMCHQTAGYRATEKPDTNLNFTTLGECERTLKIEQDSVKALRTNTTGGRTLQ